MYAGRPFSGDLIWLLKYTVAHNIAFTKPGRLAWRGVARREGGPHILVVRRLQLRKVSQRDSSRHTALQSGWLAGQILAMLQLLCYEDAAVDWEFKSPRDRWKGAFLRSRTTPVVGESAVTCIWPDA